MGGAKEPNPWGCFINPLNIEDGTLSRAVSPMPGPVGTGPDAYPYGVPGGRIPVADRIDPGRSGLVQTDKYGEEATGRERVYRLTPRTLEAFRALRAAALAAGFDRELFTLTSAHRSAGRQAELAQAARQRYGSAQAAGRWVAQGVSEHITGRAFDLNLGIANSSGNARSGAFEELAAFKWLQGNAQYFGLSPYDAEPWHWSYNPVTQ